MTSSSHAGKRKNVLIAVAGQTPAIVTETLWALERQQDVQIDEIRVITTSQGRTILVRELLGENGRFNSYCRDYDVAPGRIAFSEKNVHVLLDAQGRPLEDIRSSRDNRVAADRVYALIKHWTARQDEILFCSAAGGRKTLGIYLAMALMLCGRAEDRLLHVLVAPEFESGVREFFYPPPEEKHYQCFMGLDSDNNPVYHSVSSQQACIELADIPFLRMREIIGGELPLEKGLVETVAHSQLLLNYLHLPPKLTLLLDQGLVRLGHIQFTLSRQLIAVYTFFLIEFNRPEANAAMQQLFEKRLVAAELERLIDRQRQGEHEAYAWETMNDLDDFRARIGPCISKINRTVNKAFGRNRLAQRYRISTGRKYGVYVPDYEILETEGRPFTRVQQ